LANAASIFLLNLEPMLAIYFVSPPNIEPPFMNAYCRGELFLRQASQNSRGP
jgi:hypothetical protein